MSLYLPVMLKEYYLSHLRQVAEPAKIMDIGQVSCNEPQEAHRHAGANDQLESEPGLAVNLGPAYLELLNAACHAETLTTGNA